MSIDSPVTTEGFIELENKYGAKNYKPLNVVLSKGQGVWVWDIEGKRYLDCLSAYSAVNQGHCHPKIIQAMIDQAQKMTLCSRAFRNDQLGLFYKELCEMTDSNMVLPMNSGAEAVESVIKAVRKWGYKCKYIPEGQAEIIVCNNNFHGRTVTIISFSSEPQYKDGYSPYTPGFKLIPFGDAEALEAAITPNTVAFMVEPIQGEGGIILPPEDYLKKVREICTRKGIMFVTDEIQTGLGRTGKMLAEEHFGVQADVTVIGKALSGGAYPVSAVLSNKEVLGVFHPGDHGSTFGGNPLACAVARVALRVLKEENLLDNAAKLGSYFMENLKKIKSPYIKEIRGKGMLIGVELFVEAGGARKFCEALQEEGVLCKETHDHVIRFAPPLVIKKDEIDWALERIDKVLTMSL
ncbi:MAG TPA: ornithine--oxo-acid transaminase [Lentisphaeria bacterium]|nr:MAG: ornithine--oxo-acid transaminase [Lentisphaerae bacterium GWF2_38_69]HBM16116.1 ornithine--oxo-acid transaminase [Lentisphaeria bacterium]